MRYSLRTLVLVMLLSGPAIAGIWWLSWFDWFKRGVLSGAFAGLFAASVAMILFVRWIKVF